MTDVDERRGLFVALFFFFLSPHPFYRSLSFPGHRKESRELSLTVLHGHLSSLFFFFSFSEILPAFS